MGGVTVSPNPELSAEDFFVKTVTAEDVRHGLETSDKLVVIDTAAKKVYEDCHIIGAINIPLEDLNEGVEGIGRDTPIILYCATNKCPRSTKAAQLLKQRGYVDVAVYQGGMRDWYNLQHPYDGPADRPYLKSKAK
ncbi:hypothetical protein COB28_01170 [Candidatus Dependentiae bacterium]|nr:MAG: hypothetical protein COB28_01170 [Candidatus Dependentiae bacterium]